MDFVVGGRRGNRENRNLALRVRLGSARILGPGYGRSKYLRSLARPRGVEPLTPRSVVWCSIQLSYGRLCHAAAGMPAARAATITPAFRLWQGHLGTFPGAR